MMKATRLKFLVIGLAATLALSACAGGGNDPNNGGGNNGADAGGDAGADVEEDAQDPDLQEVPGAVEVGLDPSLAVYLPAAKPEALATVYNIYGDPLNGADVEWSVTPSDAASQNADGRWEFAADGPVTFEACTVEAGQDGNPVCGQKRVYVDTGPPNIELTSPQPGEQLGVNGETVITVEGIVEDTADDLQAFVNGEEVTLAGDGSFSAEIEPVFGVNHINVVATDGLRRMEGSAQMDVLWAPAYGPTDSTQDESKFGYQDGMILDLGQAFFDDGQSYEQIGETEIVTSDVADVLQLLLENVDFLSQIPDPLFDEDALTLRVLDLRVGQPQLFIDVTDSGLEMFIFVEELDLQTAGSLDFNDQNLNLDGSINAQMSAVAVMDVAKPSPTDEFEAQITQLDIALENAESNFASSEADAVFKLAESALRSEIEAVLIDTLEDQFIQQLPDLLAGALQSLEDSLNGLSFDLDTDFTDPVSLSLAGNIYKFETAYRDSAVASLTTDVTADKAPVITDSAGIPLTTPLTSDVPFYESSRAQIGLRLALLNGLLHSMWEVGFLEIDLTPLLPENFANVAESASLSAKLQPVLSEPEKGQPYDFMLRAGQMEVEVELPAQTDTYAISIEAGILVTLRNNQIQLSVPDEPEISAWVVDTTGDSAFFGGAALENLILDTVWPELEETLRTGLSFDLPVLDLSGLSSLAPALTTLEFDYVLNRAVSLRAGFIILDATLEGSLPLQ
ncbi:MAG: hypothetical protein ACQEVA_11100 [Myxococcota bacterium]